MSAEVVSVLLQDVLGPRKVTDSVVRTGPLVESPVVGGLVATSGTEVSVVRGHVVAVVKMEVDVV